MGQFQNCIGRKMSYKCIQKWQPNFGNDLEAEEKISQNLK